MGEDLMPSLSMENNHHPSTFLSMDLATAVRDEIDREMRMILSRPPDINLPLSAERSPPPPAWSSDSCDILEVGLGSHIYETETVLSLPKMTRKCNKRVDSIWGAWFFFSFYFKPVLVEKSKGKIIRDCSGLSGFDKSDIRLDVFLVQHDMENMYMWVFKEKPENALGKMQLRSYMNGHSRLGEPQFPFSVERGFVRSHRMQRKQYRGLSNPQCVHGIEVVKSPNLTIITENDRKKWMDLTGRDLNFSIPLDASDFATWRNLPNPEFELDRPLNLRRRLLNGSGLNLSTVPSNHVNGDEIELSPSSNKRKKDIFQNNNEEDCFLSVNSYSDKIQNLAIHQPDWINEFSGVMEQSYGPVTASKTIYEDEEGYLIMVSLPFSDFKRVKVSWRNNITHGIVKIACVSTARMPFIKRRDRTFKLTDPSPEHCPPGEYTREISLPTRIPECADLEAYFDETGTILEIIVPKYREGSEEHEVRVSLRPHLSTNDLLLT